MIQQQQSGQHPKPSGAKINFIGQIFACQKNYLFN